MRTRVSSAFIMGTLGLLGLLAAKAGGQPAGKKDLGKQFGDLVGAIKGTPGCLGVETAKTTSGKLVIFGWFEDKKAALKWYHSDTHQELMKKFAPGFEPGEPLRHVPDDSGPIMAIASLTLTDKPPSKEKPLPVAQISIELYQPLSGGLHLGGRFAPDGLKVPRRCRDYTPKPK